MDWDVPTSSVELDLQRLMGRTLELAGRFRAAHPDQDLVLARLADGLRDMGVVPPHLQHMRSALAPVDVQAWRRLACTVELLRDPTVVAAVAEQIDDDALSWVQEVLIPAVEDCPELTLEVVARSPVRCEEAARRFVAMTGATIEGEDGDTSVSRLRRLDYGRLLRQADGA